MRPDSGQLLSRRCHGRDVALGDRLRGAIPEVGQGMIVEDPSVGSLDKTLGSLGKNLGSSDNDPGSEPAPFASDFALPHVSGSIRPAAG